MKMNAPDIRNEDGSTFNSEDDPRLTKVGKFIRKASIDETPQILNILKGDMSFIGPRPDLPEDLKIYTDYQKQKLNVRPGITGYSQAFFRNSISQNEKFNNDVYYAKNISFVFDMKILLKTIKTVLKKENVYKNSEYIEVKKPGN
jgi:undecaprenyl phosphate N,N'-diacetylbacillosamine 1-phosphate transferase